MIIKEAMRYACGTYFMFELRGPAPTEPDMVALRWWVESLPGGMGSVPEEIQPIPLELILAFAEEYNKTKENKHV
jgi:hypothetical protein